MKIAVSGKAGSGKSTVSKNISKALQLKHYSMGDLMRQIAHERGMDILELSKVAETDKSIDTDLDNKQKALTEEDGFIIDGRLTAYFIPNADLKVFLTCEDTVRASRILKDHREDEEGTSVADVLSKIHQREESERKRYKELYNVDYYDKELYDLIIDTSDLTIEQTAQKILDHLKD